MNHILIVGAKSDIAKEIAKIYAKHGYNLYLASRGINMLELFANDIKIRNSINVKLKEFDITAFNTHENFYNNLKPKPIGVIVAAGYMVDEKECENSFSKSLNTINVNYTGAVSILNIIANNFQKQKKGFIVGISSVAGDRGRKANYIYGSAKAGLTTYLSGLRNRLYDSGIQVLTVKPGFVSTKMTKNLDLPPKLTSSPKDVAQDIYKAQQNGKDTLYIKWVWKYIMLIIRYIPETIFKKMSI